MPPCVRTVLTISVHARQPSRNGGQSSKLTKTAFKKQFAEKIGVFSQEQAQKFDINEYFDKKHVRGACMALKRKELPQPSVAIQSHYKKLCEDGHRVGKARGNNVLLAFAMTFPSGSSWDEAMVEVIDERALTFWRGTGRRMETRGGNGSQMRTKRLDKLEEVGLF